ncbi:GNAT family N-acetyltransferase [Streptomyces sp. NPDC052301]|uniref:GNAT family N-acetyltransferase n=1 Tax=Streptomyces sp. NPDC052301 TaxID=3365687 RepID=UPI0037D29827
MSRSPVTLRRIAAEDWPAVHAWAGLAEACRFQPWGPNTREQTRDFVATAAKAWSDHPRHRHAFAAVRGQDVVGMGELWVRSTRDRQGEIAYVVHPRLWGQGIATWIGRELLARGFCALALHRIRATCDPRNTGSSRVLTKLGMTCEGHLRHTQLIRDGWRDSLVFSILEEEWRTRSRNGEMDD